MLEKLKILLKDSFIYGLSRYISKFIAIFFIPIYTRIFSPAEYGVVDLIGASISILDMLLILGLDSATGMFYYENEDKYSRKIIVSTSLYFRMAFSIIVCSLLFFSSDFISELIFNSVEYAIFFKIGFATLPFTLAIGFFLDLMRLKFDSFKFSIISIGNAIVTSGLIIYFVIFLKLGIKGIFLGALVSSIIFFFIGLYLTYDNYIVSFSLKRFKELISFGLPLLPASMAALLMTYADRFFLLKYSTLEEVGLYSVGLKFSNVLILVISAFQLAWGPFALSLQKEKDAKKTYSKILTYYLVLTSFAAICLSLFSKEILTIMTQTEYIPAYKIVGTLSYATLFTGLYSIVSMGLILSKKTYFISIATGISGLVNVILCLLLIPNFGMFGAAISILFANLCSIYLLYLFSQKYYYIQYEIKKIATILSLSGAIIIISIFININNIILNYSIKLSLILFFVMFLLLNVFEKKEVDLAIKTTKNILNTIRTRN